MGAAGDFLGRALVLDNVLTVLPLVIMLTVWGFRQEVVRETKAWWKESIDEWRALTGKTTEKKDTGSWREKS